MATYTTVADGNGDFAVSFPASYTGGEKITVTSEKDAAIKSIELHAPSGVVEGGFLQYSGDLSNFPRNIGVLTLNVSGAISNYAMQAVNNDYNIFKSATGLVLSAGVTSIGNYSFSNWRSITMLDLPEGLLSIGSQAFSFCESLPSVVIPSTVIDILGSAFYTLSQSLSSIEIKGESGALTIGASAFNTAGLNTITSRKNTPPIIPPDFFSSLKPSCVIYVPASALSAYQSAVGWSAVASKIQAI